MEIQIDKIKDLLNEHLLLIRDYINKCEKQILETIKERKQQALAKLFDDS